MKHDQNPEVIIIGGGPAGLSAGLVLGRSRINTLILDSRRARSLATKHSHGFLTQDGKHPSEILEIARKQLSKYPSVSYQQAPALEVRHQNQGFEIKTSDQWYYAKRLILATGYKDGIDSLKIEGLSDVYGKSVYPCPFCDGFELADKKLAVFSPPEKVLGYTKKIFHWSKDIVVFTNGEQVASEVVAALDLHGIRVVREVIGKLISKDGNLKAVLLENGENIEREAGFIADTKSSGNSDFALKLGVPSEPGPVYQVDENHETEIKGLFIIGDAVNGWSGVAKSVAEGSMAGRAVTLQTIEEYW